MVPQCTIYISRAYRTWFSLFVGSRALFWALIMYCSVIQNSPSDQRHRMLLPFHPVASDGQLGDPCVSLLFIFPLLPMPGVILLMSLTQSVVANSVSNMLLLIYFGSCNQVTNFVGFVFKRRIKRSNQKPYLWVQCMVVQRILNYVRIFGYVHDIC